MIIRKLLLRGSVTLTGPPMLVVVSMRMELATVIQLRQSEIRSNNNNVALTIDKPYLEITVRDSSDYRCLVLITHHRGEEI